ncbi:MAG: hypothetical protein NTV51_30300 [Verrucomicrobia bacterium]|nr:hypothetical protein [Verrucomicrobiota bacterium]
MHSPFSFRLQVASATRCSLALATTLIVVALALFAAVGADSVAFL